MRHVRMLGLSSSLPWRDCPYCGAGDGKENRSRKDSEQALTAMKDCPYTNARSRILRCGNH